MRAGGSASTRRTGSPFPPARERLDFLETTIETCRALWAAGTKAYDGGRVSLPETTSYPRPAHEIPVIVGGSGEQRTLAIAARLGDACNLPSDPEVLARKLLVLDRHLAAAGRTRDDVAVTVLDLPVVGRDREDAWAEVERLRGRTPATAFAKRTNAGTVAQHRARYTDLAARGVSTVFVGVRGLESPDQVLALAGLTG